MFKRGKKEREGEKKKTGRKEGEKEERKFGDFSLIGHLRSLAPPPLARESDGVIGLGSGNKSIPEPLDQLGINLQSDFTVCESWQR